jgi:hypothetical protein
MVGIAIVTPTYDYEHYCKVLGRIMPIYNIDYYERVNNYWSREIEADNVEQAKDLFLKEIQGTEPDDVDVIDNVFEPIEESE